MQNTTATTTVHRNDIAVAADWDDEALALAQRVNHKIKSPLPAVPEPPLEDGEYEPQSLSERPRERTPAKRR